METCKIYVEFIFEHKRLKTQANKGKEETSIRVVFSNERSLQSQTLIML